MVLPHCKALYAASILVAVAISSQVRFVDAQAPLAVMDYRVSELAVRQGSASVRFDVALSSADTFVALTGPLRSALYGALTEVSPPTATSFGATKNSILTTASFAVEADSAGLASRRMTVTFDASTAFDVASPCSVRFAIPASAMTSGLAPVPATFVIMPLNATVSFVAAPYTFTEEQLRAGGATLALTLSPGETWRDTRRCNFTSNIPKSQSEWAKYSIVPTSSRVAVGGTLTVTLAAVPLLDLVTSERITVKCGVGSVAKANFVPLVAGGVPLTFDIVPSQGYFSFPKPYIVPEYRLYQSGITSIPVTLEYGESWNPQGINLARLRDSLFALQNEPNGFNARKSSIIANVSFWVSSRVLILMFRADPSYDISFAEEIEFEPPAMFTKSNIEPTVYVNPLRSFSFTVQPSPARVAKATALLTEQAIRENRANISITLWRGETFRLGQEALWSTNLVVAPGSPPTTPTSFASVRASLLPSNRILLPAALRYRVAVLDFVTPNTYDIARAETLRITLAGGLMDSGVPPSNGTVTVRVLPSADRIGYEYVGPRAQTPGATTFTITESDIRDGNSALRLRWAGGWETFDYRYISYRNVSVIEDEPGWQNGMLGRIKAGYVIKNASFVFSEGQNRTLTVLLQGDTNYDINVRERVRIRVPIAAIASRLSTVDGRETFDFFINPSGGVAQLQVLSALQASIAPAALTELDMRRGITLIVKLDPGETWSYLTPPATARSTIVNALKPTFTSTEALTEAYGFMQNLNIIFDRATFTVDATKHEMKIVFPELPLYDLQTANSEVVTMRLATPFFPLAAVRSGLPMATTAVTLTISKSPPVVNMTIMGRLWLDESTVQSGNWKIRFGLAAHDSWRSDQRAAFIAAFTGSISSGTTFTALRDIILINSKIDLPAVNYGGKASATASSCPAYQINATEVVTVALPASMFLSNLPPIPLSFSFEVRPSRGTITPSAYVLQQSQLLRGSLRFALRLSREEMWTQAAPKLVRIGIASSSTAASATTGVRAYLNALIRSANVTVSGQDLVFKFSPTPAYAIQGTFDNITFYVPRAAVASGLAPITGKSNGTIVVRVLTSPPVLTVTNHTITEATLFRNQNVPPTKVWVTVGNGGTFVTTQPLKGVCETAIRNSMRLSGGSYFRDDKLATRFSPLRVLGPPTIRNDRSMYFPLRRYADSGAIFMDINSKVRINATVPSVCFTSRVAARNPVIWITFVPSAPTISVLPRVVREEQIRSGSVNFQFTLRHDRLRSGQIVAPLQLAMTVTPSLLAAQAAGVRNFRSGYYARVGVLQPTWRQRSSQDVLLQWKRDTQFDIEVDEVMSFASLNLRPLINSTIPVEGLNELFVTIKATRGWCLISTVPGQGVRTLSQALIRLRDMTRLPRNITVRMYGDQFRSDAASLDLIRNAIVAMPAAPSNGLSSFLSIAAPSNAWIVNHRAFFSELVVPLNYPNPGTLFNLDADTKVTFDIPAASVMSGEKPNVTQAIVWIVRPKPMRFTVAPGRIRELDVRQKAITISITMRPLFATKQGGSNDTFTSVGQCALGSGVTFVNASVQGPRAAPAPYGFFGRQFPTRMQVGVVSRRLWLTLPLDPYFQVDGPQRIQIMLASSCFTSAVPPSVPLFVDFIPDRATLTVAATYAGNGLSVLTPPTNKPPDVREVMLIDGRLVINVTSPMTSATMGHERFRVSNASRVLAWRSFACSPPSSSAQSRWRQSVLPLSSVVITPTWMAFKLRRAEDFDVASAFNCTFTVHAALMSSNLRPVSVVGWGQTRTPSNRFSFRVVPDAGSMMTITRAYSSPATRWALVPLASATVTERSLRVGITWVDLTLNPGERWVPQTQRDPSRNVTLTPHVAAFVKSWRRAMFPRSRWLLLTPRTLRVGFNHSAFNIDRSSRLQLRVPPAFEVRASGAVVASMLPLRNPVVLLVNVTPDPGFVTVLPSRMVPVPRVAQRNYTLLFRLVDDTWAKNAIAFISMRSITLPRTSGATKPYFPAYNRTVDHVLQFATKMTRVDDRHIRVIFGRDRFFDPLVSQVVRVSFAPGASARGQRFISQDVNLTFVAPQLFASPGILHETVLYGGESNTLPVKVNMTLMGDSFLSTCSMSHVTVSSVLLPSRKSGASDPWSFVSLFARALSNNGQLRVRPQMLSIWLSSLPQWAPCASREVVSFSIASACFLSNARPAGIPTVTIAARNSTAMLPTAAFASSASRLRPDPEYPGRYTIDEDVFREQGVTFNLTVQSRGGNGGALTWLLRPDMIGLVANRTWGSFSASQCPTCFNALRRRILGPATTIIGPVNPPKPLERRFGLPTISANRYTLTVRFRPQPYYSLPPPSPTTPRGEQIVISDVAAIARCPLTPTRPLFAFTVLAKAPTFSKLAFGWVPGQRPVPFLTPSRSSMLVAWAGQPFLVNVSGVDLTAWDLLRLVDVRDSCGSLSLPTSSPPKSSDAALRTFIHSVVPLPRTPALLAPGASVRILSLTRFLVTAWVAKRHRICYAAYSPSRSLYRPFVDLSAQFQMFVSINAVVNDVAVAPLSPGPAGMIAAGQSLRVTFRGMGLSGQMGASDAVRLIDNSRTSTTNDCTSPAALAAMIFTTVNLDRGNAGWRNTTIAMVPLATSGTFSWCYKPVNSSRWRKVGRALNVTAVVNAVTPRQWLSVLGEPAWRLSGGVDTLLKVARAGVQPAAITVIGRGFDTRRGRDVFRLVAVDPRPTTQPRAAAAPCEVLNATIVLSTYDYASVVPTRRSNAAASKPGGSRPSWFVNGARVTSPFGTVATYPVVPLTPLNRQSLSAVYINLTAAVPPGDYALCYSSNAFPTVTNAAQDRYRTWRDVRRLRVVPAPWKVNVTRSFMLRPRGPGGLPSAYLAYPKFPDAMQLGLPSIDPAAVPTRPSVIVGEVGLTTPLSITGAPGFGLIKPVFAVVVGGSAALSPAWMLKTGMGNSELPLAMCRMLPKPAYIHSASTREWPANRWGTSRLLTSPPRAVANSGGGGMTVSFNATTMGVATLCWSSTVANASTFLPVPAPLMLIAPVFARLAGGTVQSVERVGVSSVRITLWGRGFVPEWIRGMLVPAGSACPAAASTYYSASPGPSRYIVAIDVPASTSTMLATLPFAVGESGAYFLCINLFNTTILEVNSTRYNFTASLFSILDSKSTPPPPGALVTNHPANLLPRQLPAAVTFLGAGLNLGPFKDRVMVSRTTTNETLSNCSLGGSKWVVVPTITDLGPDDSVGASQASVNLPPLESGNYTVCFGTFPDYRLKPQFNFRVRSSLLSWNVVNQPPNASTFAGVPFQIRIVGADVALFARNDSQLFLTTAGKAPGPSCKETANTLPSATTVRASSMVIVSTTELRVTFNATEATGRATLCVVTPEHLPRPSLTSADASRYSDYAAPELNAHEFVLIVPQVEFTPPPEGVFINVPTTLIFSGVGISPSTMAIALGPYSQSCAQLAAAPSGTFLLAAVIPFQTAALTDIVFNTTSPHRVCLLAVGSSIPMGVVNVTCAVTTVRPALVPPSVALMNNAPLTTVTLFGYGFDTRGSLLGHRVTLVRAPTIEAFADCGMAPLLGPEIADLGPGDDPITSVMSFEVPRLASGNVTVCLSRQAGDYLGTPSGPIPRVDYVAVANFRVVSAMPNATYDFLTPTVTLPFDAPTGSLTGIGDGFMTPSNALPIVKALHLEGPGGCGDLVDPAAFVPPGGLPPPLVFANQSSAFAPGRVWPPPPPEAADPFVLPRQPNTASRRQFFAPVVTARSPNYARLELSLPLMGWYTLCVTSAEQYPVYVPVALPDFPMLTVEGSISAFRPAAAFAGFDVSLQLLGTGLYAPLMNATVLLFANGPCPQDPAAYSRAVEHASPEPSPSQVAIGTTRFDIAGIYRVCVSTFTKLAIEAPGTLRISANANAIGTVSVEQYDAFALVITGAGLTLDDYVFVSAFGCATQLPAQRLVAVTNTRIGLTNVTVTDFSTDTVGSFTVCYRSAVEDSTTPPKSLGVVAIFAEVRYVSSVTAALNPSGDQLVLTLTGRGLNLTAGGDSLRLIVGSSDCTSQFTIVTQQTNDLGPNNQIHQRTAVFIWNNASFADSPIMNVSVCYRQYTAAQSSYVGYFVLPLQNQPPTFLLGPVATSKSGSGLQGVLYHTLYSGATVQTASVAVATSISPGRSPNDAKQRLWFTLLINDSSPFMQGPWMDPLTGMLNASLKEGGVDVNVLVTATLQDDGGTVSGGRDRSTLDFVLAVRYPVNTPPQLSWKLPSTPGVTSARQVYVLTRSGDAVQFYNPFDSLPASGSFSGSWESQQRLTYAANTTALLPYITFIRVLDNGTFEFTLDLASASALPRSKILQISLEVRDDGGRPIPALDRDSTGALVVDVVLVVKNSIPQFTWIGPLEIVAVVNEPFALFGNSTGPNAPTTPISMPVVSGVDAGAGDILQVVSFDVAFARVERDNRLPFRCVGTIVPATRTMLGTSCDTSGNFTMTIVLVDDGGRELGGLDRSLPVTVTVRVVDPFSLRITPSSGGTSQSTVFDFDVVGGMPSVNPRLFMELRLITGTSLQLATAVNVQDVPYVVIRSLGPLTYSTKSLPTGDPLSVYARLIDFNGNLLAVPRTTVSVGEMPKAISLASVETTLRDNMVTDAPSVVFGVFSVGSALGKVNSNEALPDRRLFLRLLLDLVRRRAQQMPSRYLTPADLVSMTLSLTNLCQASAEGPPASLSMTASTGRRLLQLGGSVAMLPHEDVKLAALIVRELAERGNTADISRAEAERLLSATAVILRSVPQWSQPIRSSSGASTNQQGGGWPVPPEFDRVQQNQAATDVVWAAHAAMQLECRRMKDTLALTGYSYRLENGQFAAQVDLVPAGSPERRKTFAVSSSYAVPYAVTFDRTTSPLTCVTLVSLDGAARASVLSSGLPQTLAWSFLLSVSSASFGIGGSLGRNPTSGAELGFLAASAPSLKGGIPSLLAYNNVTDGVNDWYEVTGVGQSGGSFVVPPSAFQLASTQANLPFQLFAVGLIPEQPAAVTYVAVMAPLMFLLFIVHYVVSLRMDRPDRGKFLKADHLESLLPLTLADQWLNNHLFFSPFLGNASYRFFARHHRVQCLWTLLFSPLLLMTVVQDPVTIRWDYEASSPIPYGPIVGWSILMSLVGVVAAHLLWFGFNVVPKNLFGGTDTGESISEAGGSTSAPLSTHAKCVIASTVVFLLWVAGCFVSFVLIGMRFNARVLVDAHWQSILIHWVWAFFWETVHCCLLIFVLQRTFPATAKRYVHPCIASINFDPQSATPYVEWSPHRGQEEARSPSRAAVEDKSVPLLMTPAVLPDSASPQHGGAASSAGATSPPEHQHGGGGYAPPTPMADGAHMVSIPRSVVAGSPPPGPAVISKVGGGVSWSPQPMAEGSSPPSAPPGTFGSGGLSRARMSVDPEDYFKDDNGPFPMVGPAAAAPVSEGRPIAGANDIFDPRTPAYAPLNSSYRAGSPANNYSPTFGGGRGVSQSHSTLRGGPVSIFERAGGLSAGALANEPSSAAAHREGASPLSPNLRLRDMMPDEDDDDDSFFVSGYGGTTPSSVQQLNRQRDDMLLRLRNRRLLRGDWDTDL
mgnify:CR=1 FL=1